MPVVKSNLTFNIKPEESRKSAGGASSPSVPVQLKSEQLVASKEASGELSKNYEDVSNMLKRMQVRKEETHRHKEAQGPSYTNKAALEDEIDAVEEDNVEVEEEGYIEMEEKEPFYEQVKFPPSDERPAGKSITNRSSIQGITRFRH